MTRKLFRLIFISCATFLASSCADKSKFTAEYSWMLPKTVLDTTTTYSFTDCTYDAAKNKLKITADISIIIVPRGVPDINLGKFAPNGWISVKTGDLVKFWEDTSFEVKTYQTTHILQLLTSTATNQTGTIVGNMFTGAVKLAGIGFGVPTAATNKGVVQECGGANSIVTDKITPLRNQLKSLDLNSDQAKKISAEIQNYQNSIDITIKRTIDAGITPVESAPDDEENKGVQPFEISGDDLKIALIRPTVKQLSDVKWFSDGIISDIKTKPGDYPSDIDVNIYLDFPMSNPSIQPTCDQKSCGYPRTTMTEGSQFREVAYIPVAAYRGDADNPTVDSNKNLILRQTIAFGQFGPSRSMPLSAPIFGKINWSLAFADNGEITDATFGSQAIGTGASSLLSGAATSASSIAADQQKAASLGNAETQRLLLENTNLTAAINNANLKQQYEALRAKGLVQ